MKRWVCPYCKKGVLGPERSGRHPQDIRFYCLDCSKKWGVLVGRLCPAALRAAAAEGEKREARRSRVRDKRMRGIIERWTVLGEDVRELAKTVWKALGSPAPFPRLRLRRRSKGITSGRAWPSKLRVVLSVGPDATLGHLRGLVVHELAHVAVGDGHGHDRVFNKTMCDAAAKLWGTKTKGGHGYAPSHELDAELALLFPTRREDSATNKGGEVLPGRQVVCD